MIFQAFINAMHISFSIMFILQVRYSPKMGIRLLKKVFVWFRGCSSWSHLIFIPEMTSYTNRIQHIYFYCLQLMAITLKEFSQFIFEFVNKNFIPHLQTGTHQHQKSLQRWRQLTQIIRDVQKVSVWTLQSYLKKFDSRASSNSDKESKQGKKSQNSRPTPPIYSTQYHFIDKKQALPTSFSYEEQTKVNSSLKGNSKEGSQPRIKFNKYEQHQTKLSFESKPAKQKTESVSDPEGFEKLIQSFRKLCSNFQNNHKKLIKQEQNYKENNKEQLTEI